MNACSLNSGLPLACKRVVSSTVGGRWNVCTLLGWLGLAFVAALMIWVKAAGHPIRGRSDATDLWKAQFPTHTEAEIQRFIRVVVLEEFLTTDKTLGELFVYVTRLARDQSTPPGFGPSHQGENLP